MHHAGFPVIEPKPEKAERSDQHDWKSGAPRWLLVTIIIALLPAAAWLAGQRFGTDAEVRQLITQYARLSERVASLETEMTLARAVANKTIQTNEALQKATQALTTEVQVLRVEMRQWRRR